jgi:hypothetical protein
MTTSFGAAYYRCVLWRYANVPETDAWSRSIPITSNDNIQTDDLSRSGMERLKLSGYRQVITAARRTYKLPPSALSKITFRAGRSRASQTPNAPDAAGVVRQGAPRQPAVSACGVRTAPAKGQKPTSCGLEAPGALRRTLHTTYKGEAWYMLYYWAGAPVQPKFLVQSACTRVWPLALGSSLAPRNRGCGGILAAS